jgi:hypothetical protein
MLEPTPAYTNRLQCVECGRVLRDRERGWTAYLTVDEDEPVEAVVYCPKCDERVRRHGVTARRLSAFFVRGEVLWD